MEQLIYSLVPAEKLIHMTAAYSNAVLLVVLTNVSDFAKKLDLPIPQPVTITQVKTFFPEPIKDSVGGVLILTNGDRFCYNRGHVSSFLAYKNFLTAPSDIEYGERDKLENWAATLFGPVNMTTNEVIEFARDALRKLDYDPAMFNADRSPTRFYGPTSTSDGKSIPFCEVEWRNRRFRNYVRIAVNAQRKRIVRFSLTSTNAWRPDPKLDVQPELESEYRKRIQRPMFIRTNAPPRLPRNDPANRLKR